MKNLIILSALLATLGSVEASERLSSQEFHLAWTKGKVCLVEDGEITAASDKLLNTLIVDYDNCYRSDVTIIKRGQINDDIYRDAMSGEY